MDIQTKLSAPFNDADIEWRLQWVNDEKNSGIAVPYVTNRAIQARLDSAAGVGGWKNEYIPWHSDGKKQSQLCGISIYFEDKKDWITKYDGAENSDIEPIKGGLSDSMKRAAVQWGIGRYLYEMESVYVDVELRGRNPVIKQSARGKMNAAHQKAVKDVFRAAVTEREEPARAVKSQPENLCYIIKAVTQPGISGSNTHMQLRNTNGMVIQAYLNGTDPAIADGKWIRNAVISQKIKEGIVFNTLDAYVPYDPADSNAA